MTDPEIKIDSYSLVRKSSVYTAIGKIITPVVTFLVTIYIVRKLSVGEFGIYNVLLGVMMYIGLFSSLGLPSILQRFIPEFQSKKSESKIKKLVLHGSFFRTALAVVFVLVIIIFSGLSGAVFKIDNWMEYFQIFAFGILFFLEAELIGLALTSLFLHKYFVISHIVYGVFRGLLLYFLLNRGYALKGLLLGEVVMYGILLTMLMVFYVVQFVRKCPRDDDTSQAKLPIKRLMKYGSFSYFNEMGVTILDVSTDFFVISAFLGPVAVGMYAFADRVSGLFSRILPHALLGEVIRPIFFSKYVDTDSKDYLEKMGNLLIKIIAFFSIPLTFGIIVLGNKIIIHLFDPKYISSLTVLWIVVSFLTIRQFQAPFGLILQSLEKVDLLFYSKIFSVYNLIMDVIIVQFWGITGVAAVTGSAVLFQNVFLHFFIKKQTGLSLSFKPIFMIIVNSSPMTILMYFLNRYITGIFSLGIISFLGILVYLITSYLNKVFTSEERVVMNSIIGKPIFRF